MLSIVGCGNLGKSIIRSAIKSGTKLNDIKVSVSNLRNVDIIKKEFRLNQVYTKDNNHITIKNSEYIFLCVKPTQIKDAIMSFKKDLKKDQVIISMAAGVDIDYLKQYIHPAQLVMRCMPNLPVEECTGVIGLYNHNTNRKKIRKMVTLVFRESLIMEISDEDKMDVITTLAGSGPAFISFFTRCLILHGVDKGFTLKESELIAKQTLLGSAKMLQSMSTIELMDKVASKGGCTEAGLTCMQNKVSHDILEAFEETFNRIKQIKKLLPE